MNAGISIPRVMILATLAVAGIGPAAHAGEWYLAPRTFFSSGYTGNPRFLQSGGEDEFNSLADVGAELQGGTERLRLSVTPRATFSTYRSDRDLDTNDQYLGLASSWQGERTSWSANGQYSRDSTQTSELGTTGLVQENRRHELKSLGAGSTWSVSERVSTGANVRWTDTHYVDGASAGLSDYVNNSASLYGRMVATERTTFTLSANNGWLDAAAREHTTRSAGLTLGASHQLGPRWSWSLSAGPSWVDSGEATKRSSVFSASIQRAGETFQYSAVVYSQLDPIGTGELKQTDALNMSASKALSERLTMTLSAQATRNRQVFDEVAAFNSETRYLAVGGSLRWQMTAGWALVFSLQERVQEVMYQDDSEGAVDSYGASLGVAWNGRKVIL